MNIDQLDIEILQEIKISLKQLYIMTDCGYWRHFEEDFPFLIFNEIYLSKETISHNKAEKFNTVMKTRNRMDTFFLVLIKNAPNFIYDESNRLYVYL